MEKKHKSRKVECPFCQKQRRLFNVVGEDDKASIEIKCKQCGHTLNVEINGNSIVVRDKGAQ